MRYRLQRIPHALLLLRHVASLADASNFDASLGCLLSPALGELAAQFALVAGLHSREREVVLSATSESLYAVLHSKLSRLLVLELNAARVTGRLSGDEPAQRWTQFLEISSQRSFWDEMSVHYPSLLSRVDRIVRNRCAASLRFAERWASDRPKLSALLEGAPGELLELNFGAGDSHRSGQTVAIVRCEGGSVVYKPRSVAVDRVLRDFIADLAGHHDGPLAIRVPKVVESGEHGWAEFIPHRHASDSEELRSFYRGIGYWLAIMRLLGGSDLHAENVIAHRGSPVVVDCETLFTPKLPPSLSGFGEALDAAASLVAGTVLNVGLLPGRGIGLGWRGIDSSAVGQLPGQQPMLPQPDILKAGSDEAHIGFTLIEAPMAQNHPSQQPALAEYWPEVLAGFDAMTATLHRMDAAGVLQTRVAAFADCRIRVVPRATEVYAEVGRMLWHPVSLHKQDPARQRAHDLLTRMAANVPSAPNDPAVIHAEIDDLMEGDIPFFTTLARDGQLEGPRGTHWLPPCNLVDDALQHWRVADLELERNIIQASLVSAYINDGWMPEEVSLWPEQARPGDLDARRRHQAARIVRTLVANAIRGGDGSIAWIAPVLSPTGWSVQPLEQDLYNGISGIALLLGAYLHETAAGRANPIEGLDEAYAATLYTLRLAENKRDDLRKAGVKVRPPAAGAYLGLSSQIWVYLMLDELGMDGGDGVQRAAALADNLPEAAAADEMHDMLTGTAGAIVPLLVLAHKTADARYLNMARALGDRLCEQAQRKDDQAFWTHSQWPEGVGGFAHGVTGIGWALTKLGRATGEARYLQTAQAAFAFEDALFDEKEQNWLDLRMLEGAKTAAVWCHGAVGIGLAHADLDPHLEQPQTRQVLRRAAAATRRLGLGWNHCTCHGDLGAWELLQHTMIAGEAPEDQSRERLLESILTSLEENGPSCGLARDAFAPGLMTGTSGIAYQLLRAHPDSALPSILTPGGRVS